MPQKSRKNKKNQKYETSAISPFWTRWFPLILFIAVGILVFYPPYFRGLFFNEDMFITHIITAIIFVAVWIEKIYRKDYRFLETPLDWAVLAYAGAYLLSLIGAVHPGDAMYGFLRALNYFMVYWLLTQVVRNYRDYENIMRILIAAGTGVAVIGILAAVGLSHYPSAFDGSVILSTLQYPNTTAAYLAVLSILGLTLWVKEQSFGQQIIYAAANYLMILVVLCTMSKGAWLIFAIGLIILLIGLPGVNRWKSFYGMSFMFVTAALIYSQFFPAIQGNQGTFSHLLFVLAGLVPLLVGQFIWMGLEALFHKKGLAVLVGSIAILCVLGVSLLFIPAGGESKALLDENVKTELAGLTDLSNSSWSYRVDFIRWGAAIVKDHPIIGTGAGGWNALYHQYQEYLGWTTEAHNHFIQVWVEAGTIGLLAFLAIWIGFSITGVRVHRKLKRQRMEGQSEDDTQLILIWGTLAGALALGIHAAMDFDLSLSAMCLLLWTLYALVSQVGKWEGVWNRSEKYKLPAYAEAALAIVLVFTLLIPGVSYTSAHSYGTKAAANLQELSQAQTEQAKVEHLQQAIQYYEKAASLDGHNSGYRADLAYAYAVVYQGQAEQKMPQASQVRKRVMELVNEAEKIKPYDVKVRSSLLNTCMMVGDVEGMIRQAEAVVKANPNDGNGYKNLLKVLWEAAQYYKRSGQEEKALATAREVLVVPEQMDAQKQRTIQDDSRVWRGEKLEFGAEQNEVLAKAALLVEEYGHK